MTYAEIINAVSKHGLHVDIVRRGAGGFRDLEIVGKEDRLRSLKTVVRRAGLLAKLSRVNNPDHPEYGQSYLTIYSVWDDCSQHIGKRARSVETGWTGTIDATETTDGEVMFRISDGPDDVRWLSVDDVAILS